MDEKTREILNRELEMILMKKVITQTDKLNQVMEALIGDKNNKLQ